MITIFLNYSLFYFFAHKGGRKEHFILRIEIFFDYRVEQVFYPYTSPPLHMYAYCPMLAKQRPRIKQRLLGNRVRQ